MAKYTTPAWSNGTTPAVNAANLTAIGQAIEEAQHPYGTCSTAAGTQAKTVTLDTSGSFALYTGATVRVKFSNGNTAANPTLNVESTGAKAIRSFGTTPVPGWSAGQVITLTYDGTAWLVSGSGGTSNMATGSYSGTGSYGSGSKNSLSFGFLPSVIFIRDNSTTNPSLGVIVPGIYGYVLYRYGSGSAVNTRFDASVTLVTTSVTGNTIQWYSTLDVYAQMNASGTTYSYVAFG